MWNFFCYDDGQETNLWDRWYRDAGPAVQGKHDSALEFLEVRQVAQWKGVHFFHMLKAGSGEIRISGKVAHRVIGYFSPGNEFTVVLTCNHKGTVYSPRDALKTAEKRKKEVIANPTKRRACARPGKTKPA